MLGDSRYTISRWKQFVNAMVFPYRCLFKFQGFGGFLLSMEEERMMRVAKYCRGRALDIGCGPHNRFIRNVYPEGIGVDFFPYEGVEMVLRDPTRLPFEDASFDTITLVAVGGHIPKHLRQREFKEFARILKPCGRLVMTEGEPVTQYLHHQWVYLYDKIFGTKVDVDTERGMEEDEEYCMPHQEIVALISGSGLKFLKRDRFQWGLNNVFVAEKPSAPA
jgi:SAM-dependent methyltransferase